jgi:hypothetical protein
MLRVSPVFVFLNQGAREMEKITMGNAPVAGELASADELEELFGLDASESGPEDDEDDDESDGEGDQDEDDDEGKGLDPEEIPHG